MNPSNREEEVRQVFRNIESLLEAAGACMGDLVQTITFVKDLGVYETFKKVRAEFYKSDVPPPVNSFVQVADLQLGASIEMMSVALLKKDRRGRKRAVRS